MDSATPLDIATLFDTHESERFDLHTRRLNEQMVRVLRTIGYDVGFCKGQGQYLYDRKGERYLDLLSGYGVFAIGRNHPAVRAALKSVLDADLPNLVQMDVSTLAGLLAQSGCSRWCRISKKCSSRIRARNRSRLRSSSRALPPDAPASCIAVMHFTA